MSATSKRITKTSIGALTVGQEIRDSDLKGFGARRQADETSYFLHTRIKGRLRRLTIGKHGSPYTPETARKEASRLLLAIRSGEDPTTKRGGKKNALTVDQAMSAFFADHGSKLKPRTLHDYQALYRLLVKPRLGSHQVSTVEFAEIASAHAAWSKTPRQANHALALVSKFLSWCGDAGHRAADTNPCGKIRRFRENKRDRYLSAAELVRLGEVLAEAERTNSVNRYVIAAIRLLLLTGARVSEILTLKWSYVDLDRRRIRLPDSKTGAKTLVLGDAAIAVLRSIGRSPSNPFVLPGGTEGSRLTGIYKSWWRMRTDAGLSDVRIHDLRHSYAAFAVDVGGSLPVIGKLLGHLSPQTTARYAHVAPAPADNLASAADRMIAARLMPRRTPANATTLFRRRPHRIKSAS